MALRSLLGIELPILQAPMAGVQGSALAIAVSNAGGLGALPCAMLGPEAMRREILAIRAGTDRPFNVNFFCHERPVADAARERAWRSKLAPYYREFGIDPDTAPSGPPRTPFDAQALGVLEELRPAVVSFHFGLPAPALLERLRRLRPTILASATTAREAVWLEARGVDAIIAQGVEAGGHRGSFLDEDLSKQTPLATLLPAVLRSVNRPVIAAGGIADAAAVRTALACGACAVQVGTAYLLSPEATTSGVHRAALKSRQACDTAITNLFTGRPARGILNRLMRELGPIDTAAPAFPLAVAAIAPLRAAAEARGSADFSPLWAGTNARASREVPAAELTRALAATP